MGEANLSPSRMSAVHDIRVSHIQEWLKESFLYPLGTIVAATVMYTIFTNNGLGWKFESFRLGGEAVGAGGMLLGVLLLRSLAFRVKQWRKSAAKCQSSLFDTFDNQLDATEDLAVAGMWVSIGLAVLLAWAHYHVEHTEAGYIGLSSVFLLGGNAMYVSTIIVFGKRELYVAKRLLISNDNQFVLDGRRASGQSGPATVSSMPAKSQGGGQP